MKVLLISANTELINMPTWPLGLACVAAATRKRGHPVELIDLLGEKDVEIAIRRAIEGSQPDVIGISVRNIDDQNMDGPNFLLEQVKGVVKACKTLSRAPIVLGGAGYSIFPESALEYLGADLGIQGEGEHSFPLLVSRLEHKAPLSTLPGLYISGRGLQATGTPRKSLDDFTLPAPDLLSISRYKGADFWLPVQTRRGCPLRCSYCSTGTIEGCMIRKRSIGGVIAWLNQWVEQGFQRFHFVDNTFNLPPSYARTLCSRIIERGWEISWRCILYPRMIDGPLVKEMAAAGCKEVALGFESGSPGMLKRMNKRFGLRDIRRANHMLTDHGIKRMGFLLLGGPGETKDTVEESLAFTDSLDLDLLKITLGIRIYPYTKLAQIAAQEKIIGEQEDLLFPTFYMVRGLEDWLRQTINDRMVDHPKWIF